MPVLNDEDVGLQPAALSDADVGLALSDEDVGLAEPKAPALTSWKPPMQFLPGGMNEPGTREEKLAEVPGIYGAAAALPGAVVEKAQDFMGVPKPVRDVLQKPLINPQPSAEDVAFRREHPVVGGIEAGVSELAKSFTSPIGIATLGMGSLPKAAQKAVSLAFAAQMASGAPEIAGQLIDEYRKPDSPERTQNLSKLLTSAVGTGLFTSVAAKHGLSGEKPPPLPSETTPQTSSLPTKQPASEPSLSGAVASKPLATLGEAIGAKLDEIKVLLSETKEPVQATETTTPRVEEQVAPLPPESQAKGKPNEQVQPVSEQVGREAERNQPERTGDLHRESPVGQEGNAAESAGGPQEGQVEPKPPYRNPPTGFPEDSPRAMSDVRHTLGENLIESARMTASAWDEKVYIGGKPETPNSIASPPVVTRGQKPSYVAATIYPDGKVELERGWYRKQPENPTGQPDTPPNPVSPVPPVKEAVAPSSERTALPVSVADTLTKEGYDVKRWEVPGQEPQLQVTGVVDEVGKKSGTVYVPESATLEQARAVISEKQKQFGVEIEKPAVEHTPLGASTPGEHETNPKTPTGIKNATVDAERAKRGLPPAIEPARRSFGKVWDEAMAKVDQDPQAQQDLIDELRKQPRAITDLEDALLLQRQIDLQNEYGKATRELAQAYDDAKEFPNRLADVEEQKLRVARLSDDLLDLYNINKRVGTETGRGLNARKMMAYEDYSLASMETRLRAAQDGKPLEPKQKAEVEAVAKKVEQTQKAVDDYLEKVSKDSTKPEGAALKALKTRYARRTAELEAKMLGGDLTVKGKTPLQLDAEAVRLKSAYERAKLEFDRLVMKERLKNRTILQKTQDTFVKWRRAFLLSSPVTLAKLTSAAIERGIFTPTEEIVGAVYSKLPFVSRVANLAPREGRINVKAEARAIRLGFTKGMFDSWQTLKTGHSDMDSLFGKRDVMPREVIDFIGSVHGALKAPVKRAEFERSFEKRVAFALRHGQDVSDPMVQTRICLDAYKDAQRSIFMQDNRVTAAWNAGIAILKAPDKATGKTPIGRRTLATAGQVLLPIVKVPTNIVGETLQYAVGSVTGSTRLALALRKGVETLKPDEADLIMRELKKGSLGGALLVLGYLSPQMFGGYYQQNDKKQVGHPKFGTMQIGGFNVPSMLIHNPLLETLQIGATVRHVADSKLRVHDKETQGAVQGSISAALGLTEEVPFVRQVSDMLRLMNPYERDKYADQFARDMIIPLGVSWVAQHFDKDANGNYIARDPKNLVQTIESAIPLLRKKVPVKKPKP
jgi:hypothetical protein